MLSISTLGILALVGVINVVSNPCDMTSQQNDTQHQKRYDRIKGSESISGHLLNFAHANELYIHDKWSGSHPSFAEPTKRSTNATGGDSTSGLQSSPARWLALVALMTYIAAYSLGFGPGKGKQALQMLIHDEFLYKEMTLIQWKTLFKILKVGKCKYGKFLISCISMYFLIVAYYQNNK